MPGGILNILATGNQNVFLTGNPKKTFFTAVYSKYTNFGLQKFRIDFNGLRTLRMSEDSLFTFKVPRYGDLLMDTYLVITLPHIWSPIMPPKKYAENSNAGLSANQPLPKTKFFAKTKLTQVPSK